MTNAKEMNEKRNYQIDNQQADIIQYMQEQLEMISYLLGQREYKKVRNQLAYFLSGVGSEYVGYIDFDIKDEFCLYDLERNDIGSILGKLENLEKQKVIGRNLSISRDPDTI